MGSANSSLEHHESNASSERETKGMGHKLHDALVDQQNNGVANVSSGANNSQHSSEGTIKKKLTRFQKLKTLKLPSERNLIKDSVQRFDNIYAKPLVIDEEFTAPVHEKNDEQKEFILDTIRTCFVFRHLKDDELQTLVNSMELHTVDKDEEIITRGESAQYFYILESGTVSVNVDDVEVGEGTRGETFGELALMYNCMRTATYKAIEDCSLWRVNRDTFKQIIAGNRKRKEEETVSNLKSVGLFKDLNDEMLHKIYDTLIQKRFNAGEIIIEKGKEGKAFYIIEKGAVSVTNIRHSTSHHADYDLGPGDIFGERALMSGNVRSATVVAKEDDTVLLSMNRDEFNKILGPLDELIRNTKYKQTLLNIPMLARAKVSDEDKDRLVSLLNEIKFNKNDIICKTGQWIRPSIYFVTSGSIEEISKDGTSIILENDDFFGDETFRNAGRLVESDCTIKVLEDNTTCEVLTLNAFQIVFRTLSKLVSGRNVTDSIHLESSLNFDRLKKHKMLGKGSFGQGWLVSDTMSGSTYALKLMSKRRIIKTRQWKNIIREKNLMSMIDHPFILKLVNAFQDDTFLCLVTELYLGGELFTVLHSPKNKRGLSEAHAAFYAACVIEALGYLHQRQIVYRDLKPENLLLDSHGYLVVIDLGFAKVVHNKTFTVCGTPLYIAPEVLLERGHDRAADIWSLGVLIYELVMGKTPFYVKGMSQPELFKKILFGKYTFPKGHITPEAQDLIKRIIVHRPTWRLGCLKDGDVDLREHPWFKKINFALLLRKKVDPPFVPTIKNPKDASNFEDWGRMENEFNNEKPPSAFDQKYFKEF